MSNVEVFPPWSIDLITIIMEIIIINNCSYTTGITVVVYCNVTSVHIFCFNMLISSKLL